MRGRSEDCPEGRCCPGLENQREVGVRDGVRTHSSPSPGVRVLSKGQETASKPCLVTASCVTLGKSLNLSEPQCLPRRHGNGDGSVWSS